MEKPVNTQGTFEHSVTVGLPETVRRELTALRNKHGALSAIGSRCSNIMELIKVPELPRALLERQMADLQRLLVSPQ